MDGNTVTPGGIVGTGAATRGRHPHPDRSASGVCRIRREGQGRRDGPRRPLRLRPADPVRPGQQRKRTVARLLRRPDRHASGLPDRRRQLGPDPRGTRARPLRPAEHPDRPDPVRRRRDRWPAERRHDARPHRLRLHLSAVQGADDLLHRGGPALPALRRSLRSGPERSLHLDRDPAARGRGRVHHGRHQAVGRRAAPDQQVAPRTRRPARTA